MKALGMIEVRGRLGAIEGLDASLKAANVSLVNMIRVGGGLTTFLVEGDVGAVKAAIDAGATATAKVCELISYSVIPRPDESVRRMLDMDFGNENTEAYEKEESKEDKVENSDNSVISNRGDGLEAIAENTADYENDYVNNYNKDDESEKVAFAKELSVSEAKDALENNTVGSLRRMARATEGVSMTKEEIKFAKKKELISAIKEARKNNI